MGIFNRNICYAVHFNVGVGSKNNILAFAAKNTEFLISSQELTKENERKLLKELQDYNASQNQEEFMSTVHLDKEKLKKSDMPRPMITFEELRNETMSLTKSAWQSVYKQTQTRDVKFTQQEYEEKIVSKMLEVTKRLEGDRSR